MTQLADACWTSVHVLSPVRRSKETRGSLLRESDDCPRMRMRDPAPTAPDEITCTPAARPEISSPVLVIGASMIFDETSIDATVFEISALLCTPVTVVTTAASE